MAKEIIPDKICPHCGGNEWRGYNRYGHKYYLCYSEYRTREDEWRRINKEKCSDATKKWKNNHIEKIREYSTTAREKDIKLLPDRFIKDTIIKAANITYSRAGDSFRIKASDISPEQVVKRREILKIQQFIKQNTKKQENMPRTRSVTTKEMTREERQFVYNTRSYKKKKLMGAVVVNSTPLVPKLEKELIEASFDGVSAEAPAEDILTEFTRIEARRKEIIAQVEQLNNYLDSLKIKLS